MQNSEAVQAWIQGKMATFRILILVSKTEIRSREFSFSSWSLRMKIKNLDLVSMPKIGGDFFSISSRSLRLSDRNSRSRLDVRDLIREILVLVSRLNKWLSLTSDSKQLIKGANTFRNDWWNLVDCPTMWCPKKMTNAAGALLQGLNYQWQAPL